MCPDFPLDFSDRDFDLWVLGGIAKVRQAMDRADRGFFSADGGGSDSGLGGSDQEPSDGLGFGRKRGRSLVIAKSDELVHIRSIRAQRVRCVGARYMINQPQDFTPYIHKSISAIKILLV
jgi:hypothetical protein